MARAKKRADGRYCAQIYLGRDETGRKQYKSVYAKTPAELKEKETAVRLQLGRGLDVLAQRDRAMKKSPRQEVRGLTLEAAQTIMNIESAPPER